MIGGAAALAELVRPAGETEEFGVQRVLPVAPELSGLLPGRGLRRGSTVAVATGSAVAAGGGTSLLLALLGEASRTGSWCAVVGVPSLGAVAAAESGISLDRLALVPNPGPEWPTVVAALIDGVDVVVVAAPGTVSATITSRLVARARQRGSVLVPFGPWTGADLTLQVTDGRWEGLDAGHGRLRRRRVTVLARGRGSAARPREITMWMPGLTTRPFTLPAAPGLGDRPGVPATVTPALARPERFLMVVSDPHTGENPATKEKPEKQPRGRAGERLPGWAEEQPRGKAEERLREKAEEPRARAEGKAEEKGAGQAGGVLVPFPGERDRKRGGDREGERTRGDREGVSRGGGSSDPDGVVS